MLARTRHVLALIAGCGVIVAAGAPAGSSAQENAGAPSPASALEQQRAALLAQLQNGPAKNPGVADAEQQLGVIQKQLISTQQLLAADNARLVELQAQITQNEQGLTADEAELAAIVRATYVQSGQTGLTNALLSSDTFNQAFDRFRGSQHVGDQLVNLVNLVAKAKRDLIEEQAALNASIANSQALEATLSSQSNRLAAMIVARNAAVARAAPPTQGVVSKLDVVDNQAAAAGIPGAVNAQGPCGNHFAYGQCTWYVANRRCIPWLGNAYQWWPAAQAAGYSGGHVPEAGAVIVWYPGGGGSSGVGHVGYVEAVGPDGGVPAGSFKLSEMNWGSWGKVDYRILPNNAPGISGFVYGKR